MKSIFTTLLSILFVAGIVSCGGDSQSSSDVQPGNDTTNIVDSTAIIKRQQEEAKTRDSLPQNCSAEQAINYMKTSGYWDKYSSGIIPSIVQQHLPYAQQLINNKYNHFIIVDKGSMHVILYDKYGHLKLSYKMACGRNYGTSWVTILTKILRITISSLSTRFTSALEKISSINMIW